jgi:WD40 repeat protein
VRLWNVAAHQQEGPTFPALASPIESLAVSPDGTVVATGVDDGTVRLWDVTTGKQVGQPLIAGASKGATVESVAFSPDGSMIAAGDQNSTVRVWSVPTQRQVGPALSGGVDTVNAVAFSPDSRELASADDDGSVRLWNLTALAGSQAAPPVPDGEGISADGSGAVALGPDEKLATSDNTDNVTIWQPDTGNESGYPSSTVPNPPSRTEAGGPVNLAFSPDGKTLATGANDGSVRLWNLPAGLTAGIPARTIPLPGPPSSAPTVQFLAFSPNSRQLAVYYATGTVEVFDTATGLPVAESQAAATLPGGVLALGFTPRGASVLIACSNGDVITWDPTTNATSISRFAPISSLTNAPTTAFSPDGTTIAVATSDTVQLWDMTTGQQIGNPIVPGDGTVFMLAFSPDGKTLATSAADGTIRLWNVSYLTPAGALAEPCARIRPTVPASVWTTPQQAGMSYQRACVTGG